jgi:hypothetical protein
MGGQQQESSAMMLRLDIRFDLNYLHSRGASNQFLDQNGQ